MRKLLQTHLGHRAIFIMGHILQDKYILHCCNTLASKFPLILFNLNAVAMHCFEWPGFSSDMSAPQMKSFCFYLVTDVLLPYGIALC